jgi:hypothetical protein
LLTATPEINPKRQNHENIGFFGLRAGRYRHSDYLAGRDLHNTKPFLPMELNCYHLLSEAHCFSSHHAKMLLIIIIQLKKLFCFSFKHQSNKRHFVNNTVLKFVFFPQLHAYVLREIRFFHNPLNLAGNFIVVLSAAAASTIKFKRISSKVVLFIFDTQIFTIHDTVRSPWHFLIPAVSVLI